jgi:hypothetical protein
VEQGGDSLATPSADLPTSVQVEACSRTTRTHLSSRLISEWLTSASCENDLTEFPKQLYCYPVSGGGTLMPRTERGDGDALRDPSEGEAPTN